MKKVFQLIGGLTIRTKLIVILVVAIAAVSEMFYSGYTINSSVGESIKESQHRMTENNDFNATKQAATELTLTAMDMIIDVNGDIERRKELEAELPSNVKILQEAKSNINELAHDEETKKLTAEVVANIDILIEGVNNGLVPVIMGHDPDDSAAVAEVGEKMSEFDDSVDGASAKLASLFDKLLMHVSEESAIADKKLANKLSGAVSSSFSIFLVSLIILFVIIAFVGLSIMNSIKAVVASSEEVVTKILKILFRYVLLNFTV